MEKTSGINQRKREHVDGALAYFDIPRANPFDAYRVAHSALPEISLEDVDSGVEFLGRQMAAPLIIASITGGPAQARSINENLAEAAQHERVALALGSAKIVFKEPDTFPSFDVRKRCPDVPLLANLGLADLERAFSIDDCRALVHRLGADALIFHVNPMHEALRPDGNTDFHGLFDRLRRAADALDFPVIVKEVGHGISAGVFRRLDAYGLYAVDVAGQGGASWGFIEGRRASGHVRRAVCETFSDWGLPTPLILEQLQGVPRNTRLIASGGVRNGLDAFKALCLGADLAAAATSFLKPALTSATAARDAVRQMILEFRLSLFGAGCKDACRLNPSVLIKN